MINDEDLLTRESFDDATIWNINNHDDLINNNILCVTPKYKGSTITFKTNGNIDTWLNSESYFNRLKNCNVKDIVLAPLLYIDRTGDTQTVYYNNLKVDYSIDKVKQLILFLLDKGFDIHYKIHIVNNTGGSIFLKANNSKLPTNPQLFFSKLKAILGDLVTTNDSIKTIALINEGEMITENASYMSYWYDLIDNIKTLNTTIKIIGMTFAYKTPVFIDKSDYIGCNIYPKGDTSIKTESVSGFNKNFNCDIFGTNHISKIYNLTRKYNKQFIMTESGCPPFDYNGARPEDWKSYQGNQENKQVQANYLESLLNIFCHMECCAGVFIWASDVYNWDVQLCRNVVSKIYGEV